MNPRFEYDLAHCGRESVAGADEAGRGCLAGPLVAAAVVFDYSHWTDADFAALERLDDSKKFARPGRLRLFGEVMARARQVAVVARSARSIDERGLHACNVEALRTALGRLDPPPPAAFVDGFPLGPEAVPHEALIGGDGRSAAVAAASIVAKVTRDRARIGLHRLWPDWGLDSHVGYACEAHRDAIERHGVCELHRLSFNSVAFRQLDLHLGLDRMD